MRNAMFLGTAGLVIGFVPGIEPLAIGSSERPQTGAVVDPLFRQALRDLGSVEVIQ